MIKLKSWLGKQEFLDLKGFKDGLEEGLKSDLKETEINTQKAPQTPLRASDDPGGV